MRCGVIARANRVTTPPTQCYALWSEAPLPIAILPLHSSVPASKVKRNCQVRTRKRVDRFQEKIRGEKDGRHVENSLLSKIGGSRGARESSRDVGQLPT